MKDNDLNEKLFINMQERRGLLEQLRKDCDFLEGHNIMDYSLLLGIEKGIHQVCIHYIHSYVRPRSTRRNSLACVGREGAQCKLLRLWVGEGQSARSRVGRVCLPRSHTKLKITRQVRPDCASIHRAIHKTGTGSY